MNRKLLIPGVLILAGIVYLLAKPGDRIHYDLPEWKAPDRGKISRISYGKGEKTDLRLEEGQWVVGAPARRADGEKVEKILDALENLKPTDLVSRSGYYDSFLLGETARTEVSVTDGEGTGEFSFGKRASSSQGTYALLPGEEAVLIITGDWNALLPADPGELRDRTVLTFGAAGLNILELTDRDSGKKLVFSKDGEGNWLKNGEIYGDGEGLTKKISSLSGIKCRSFVSDPLPEGPPRWKALLSVEGRETDFSVWGERDGSFLCSSSQSEDPFLLPSHTLDGLSELLEE